MINVTKTVLPPLEEYTALLERIWASGHITNNGPLLRELEAELKAYFGAKHLFMVANGTLGLQIALRALDITRKVVTTPYSYVATTGAILWEHAQPVFCDIRDDDCCIDPTQVEAAIDADTQAILAVHVYGYPCDVSALADIAQRHNLKLIYDAAHAFGSRLGGHALASYGDVSVLSFHATKLFHTVEGGAVITDDDEVAERIRLCRAFGHVADNHIALGINAKNTEFHAAMGLCMLPRIPQLVAARRELSAQYDKLLADLPLRRPRSAMTEFEHNYAYYPVVFPSEELMSRAQAELETNGIVPRRYFYPALNRLPYCQGAVCANAEQIANRVLCLPLSEAVTPRVQQQVATVLHRTLGR